MFIVIEFNKSINRTRNEQIIKCERKSQQHTLNNQKSRIYALAVRSLSFRLRSVVVWRALFS